MLLGSYYYTIFQELCGKYYHTIFHEVLSSKWGKAQEKAFQAVKDKLCSTLVLTLTNFSNTFQT